ncbi:hypothetical protein T440DRAFT_545551 [Plenodomus tracheiphilus IPT5]|uniref:Uncharacterized protein n=1 Tax=Plenodomus tracheiphilus IPT5 TaxID=1408161 RepID=A0A6A7APF7_9PLEO|nr:hypothetical protein T440DRAFT_545551 [Plenodomus tracheiphilus IPT5]
MSIHHEALEVASDAESGAMTMAQKQRQRSRRSNAPSPPSRYPLEPYHSICPPPPFPPHYPASPPAPAPPSYHSHRATVHSPSFDAGFRPTVAANLVPRDHTAPPVAGRPRSKAGGRRSVTPVMGKKGPSVGKGMVKGKGRDEGKGKGKMHQAYARDGDEEECGVCIGGCRDV